MLPALGGVGQCDPAGEIGLRVEEAVAVVLVPGKGGRNARLLVDRLVPVEADVGAHEIPGEIPKERPGTEVPQESRAQHEVNGEGDLVGTGDEATALRQLAQRGFGLGLPGVDLGDQALERGGLDGILEHEEALLAPLASLRGRDAPVGAGSGLPAKVPVERMELRRHAGAGLFPISLILLLA